MEVSKRRRGGLRRARYAVVGAVAATAVMAFGVTSAQAASQTFTASFDDAALNVSGLTFDILEPPDTATMTGTVEDTTGAVNVPNSGFVFPEFSGEAAPGIPVTVNFSAVDAIVGNLNLTSGVMTTTSTTYHANVQALGGNCDYDIDLAFSTAPGSPFNGDPFTVNGATARNITNGALQTSWPAAYFTPDPDASCATINGLVGGAGGLAMANGIDLTPAAPPSGGGTTTPPPATPVKKKKKCKKKKAKKGAEIAKKKCKKKKK